MHFVKMRILAKVRLDNQAGLELFRAVCNWIQKTVFTSRHDMTVSVRSTFIMIIVCSSGSTSHSLTPSTYVHITRTSCIRLTPSVHAEFNVHCTGKKQLTRNLYTEMFSVSHRTLFVSFARALSVSPRGLFGRLHSPFRRMASRAY